MDTEDTSPRPLQQSVHPDFESAVQTVAMEPHAPRLGIMHLIVWVTCVAVYFSFVRTIAQSGQDLFGSDSRVFPVLYGLGSGTALAGLTLLVSRRLRGFPLAKYPGEYLLLSSGVTMLFATAVHVMFVFTQGPLAEWLRLAVSMAFYIADGLVLLMATVRVKVRRWRVLFVTAIIMFTIQVLLPWTRLFGVDWVAIASSQLVSQSITGLLVVVVLADLSKREQYPWQHWLGVGLWLWFGAVYFASYVYLSLTGVPRF